MTASERDFLSTKLSQLAAYLSRAAKTRMCFDSEEQFLRMLSLEPAAIKVPVRRDSRPVR